MRYFAVKGVEGELLVVRKHPAVTPSPHGSLVKARIFHFEPCPCFTIHAEVRLPFLAEQCVERSSEAYHRVVRREVRVSEVVSQK